MASTSESTFGSRLQDAEKLSTCLQSFTGYQPVSEAHTADSLNELIAAIKENNNAAAAGHQVYSAAVNKRQQQFRKDPDSLYKLTTPIIATIRSLFGKDSKEAADIRTMIRKIRGSKLPRRSLEALEKVVSRNETSFGSITKQFADLITHLEGYGDSYKPANPRLTLEALKTRLGELDQSNTDVSSTYSPLKQSRDNRQELYRQLKDKKNRIKEAILAQYGSASSEYKMTKGL